MASAWGAAWGAAWGGAWGAITSSSEFRFAGGRWNEKRIWVIRGRRYWLTDWEAAHLIQSLQETEEPVRRVEVKVFPKEGAKPRQVSQQMWEQLVSPVDDEEEELILLLSA
jgi:hypothetical protein